MAHRGNHAIIRALRSSVTSLKKSEARIKQWAKDEEIRHALKMRELDTMLKQAMNRRAEDEAQIRELTGEAKNDQELR